MSTDLCCHPGAPSFHHPVGDFLTLCGISCYSTGSGRKFILYCTDVFGISTNAKQAADEIASRGFRVLIPDYFAGEALDIVKGVDRAAFPHWLDRHPVEHSVEIAQKIVNELFSKFEASAVALNCFCYGSKVGFLLSRQDSRLVVACHAHPSFLTIEDAEKCPANAKLQFICSAVDHAYTEEFKAKFISILDCRDICHVHFQHYPNTEHGFSIRGSQRDGLIEEMRIKAMKDMGEFFQSNL